MAKLIVNEFTEYELTADEQMIAQCLTDMTEMYLQNELANIVKQKLALSPTSDPHVSALQHEFYRGQMELLRGIISISKDAKQEAMERQLEQNKRS